MRVQFSVVIAIAKSLHIAGQNKTQEENKFFLKQNDFLCDNKFFEEWFIYLRLEQRWQNTKYRISISLA